MPLRRSWSPLTTLAVLCLTGVIARSAPPDAPAASGQTPSRQEKSIDEQLLEDLGSDLLEGLPPRQPERTLGRPAADPDATPREQRQIDGEDVQPRAGSDPLTGIADQMRRVENLIEQHDVTSRTQQMQLQIVADLDALIRRLEQQQRKQQSERKPGGGQTGTGDASISRPAGDSTDRVGRTQEVTAAAEDVPGRFKAVWGHLPDRVRQQVRSASMERFLPRYEELIERYYRRLAEEDGEAR